MPSSAHMYGVVVVGGGAAGTAAAVDAAQADARTPLFESFACLGGAATIKSVTTYCGLYIEAALAPGGVRRRGATIGRTPASATAGARN